MNDPKDWLYSSHAFTQALTYLLYDMKGIVIEAKGEMLELYPDYDKLLIFHEDNAIKMIPYEGIEEAGTRIALRREG